MPLCRVTSSHAHRGSSYSRRKKSILTPLTKNYAEGFIRKTTQENKAIQTTLCPGESLSSRLRQKETFVRWVTPKNSKHVALSFFCAFEPELFYSFRLAKAEKPTIEAQVKADTARASWLKLVPCLGPDFKLAFRWNPPLPPTRAHL